MTYQGRVSNGVVVLENGATLPDGTVVRVEPLSDPGRAEPAAGSLGERLLRFAGAAGDGLPEDLAQNHDHYLYGVPKR
jgi:hypothetical protein